MDKSAVKAAVEKHLERVSNQLAPVRSWKLTIKYEALPGDHKSTTEASCSFDYAYEDAVIRFDPEAHDDERHVVRNLRHELIHLLLAPIEAYRETITPMLSDEQSSVEYQAARVAVERCVMNVERVFDWGLNIPLLPEEAPAEEPQAAEPEASETSESDRKAE
ncbi:MAG TPA: hypothetical protein V6D06_14680 [Trichocoleus sp.]